MCARMLGAMPIHPRVAATFPLLDGIESFDQLMSDPALEQRFIRFASALEGAAPAVPSRESHAPGPHGPVRVRIYGDAAGSHPGLVWVHGGAFIGGNLDMPEADSVARHIADRTGGVVVSLDYRLAVDGVHYPVPHDDVVAGVRWVRDSAAELGIDAARISIGGASAGANLIAGAALELHWADRWQPANLLLAYPVVHPQLPQASPALRALMDEVPRILRFLPDQVRFMTENYLGGPADSADGYAMPALADLAGLCPTLVLNAEYDDLRSSGEAFSAALALAGVDVQQVLMQRMLHGFLNIAADIEQVDVALTLLAERVSGGRVGATA
jgi:acetyl esterase